MKKYDAVSYLKGIGVKGRLPFRLGSTSYIFPDDILPNVDALSTVVDDIELVLFESTDASNFPSQEIIDQLSGISRERNLTYTVHFPLDRKAGSESESERNEFASQATRVIDLTRPLDPFAFVLHLEGISSSASGKDQDAWRERVRSVCKAISRAAGDPSRVCVENLGYPFVWNNPTIEEFGFTYCIDIGHLWRYGVEDWETLIRTYLTRTRVIHLHGEVEGKDHISLSNNVERINCLLPLLTEYRGVVTLELFSATDFFPSLSMIADVWDRR